MNKMPKLFMLAAVATGMAAVAQAAEVNDVKARQRWPWNGLMFDVFVNQKGLRNLVWVWTTEEREDALAWYPGDDCVDVVGRDFYYYPRRSDHASLIEVFTAVRDLFGGRKIVALSENGSVPYPAEMEADGAHWSWFMPWYGDYAMEGWANDIEIRGRDVRGSVERAPWMLTVYAGYEF